MNKVFFFKFFTAIMILSLTSCKNESSKKSDAKKDSMEVQDLKDLQAEHIPGVLTYMHKVTITFAEQGRDQIEKPEVREFLEELRKETETLADKLSYVIKEKDWKVLDSDLSQNLIEDFDRRQEKIRSLEKGNFDSGFMRSLNEYLFDQLYVLERDLMPLAKDEREKEMIEISMNIYKQYADRSIEIMHSVQ